MKRIDNVDPTLLWLLRRAGDEWGPLGAALAAARMTEPRVLVDRLREDHDLDDEEPEPDPGQELLYTAWTVIANASGGDWMKQTPEWREAAERWRDRFHDSLTARSERDTARAEVMAELLDARRRAEVAEAAVARVDPIIAKHERAAELASAGGDIAYAVPIRAFCEQLRRALDGGDAS